METIRALAETIGPRRVGSPGEEQAAAWLAEQLRAAGCDVRIDGFRAPASFVPTYASLTLLGAAAFALAWWRPWLGAIGGLAAGGLLALENLTFETVSRVLSFHPSRNVIARRAAAGEPEQTIVILAHLDSALVSTVRDLRVVHAIFLGMLGSCVAVAAASAAVLLGAPQWALAAGAPFAAWLLASAALMLYQHLRAEVVAGAHDNATGVAAMLDAARQLPSLERSEVWFVGTGAEEPGLVGALRLVTSARLDRERTWFINLDMVGGEGLRAAPEEGMLVPLRADPDLRRLAEQEAAAEGFALDATSQRNMSTDACVPLIRGYRAVTIASAPCHWHQLTDTVATVSAETVDRAAALLQRMIVRLDDEDRGTS